LQYRFIDALYQLNESDTHRLMRGEEEE